MANKKKVKKVLKTKTMAKKKVSSPIKKKALIKTKKVAKAKSAPKKNKVKAKPKPLPQVNLKKSKVAQTKTLNIDYSKAITPLGDRLVVRLETAERVTAGGLIIPDTVSQVTGFLKAKVLAVGSGTQSKKGYLKPMDVKKGDTIFFSQHAGTKVQFNSEDLQIIKETDVMGVVQN